MEELNYVGVERRVFSTGVGNDLDLPLRVNMEKGLDEFSLPYTKTYGEVKADAEYNFKKSDKGNYFFNSMEVTANIGDEKFSQKFYVDNTYDPKLREQYPDLNANFTLKEAVNFLCGRFVMKLHVSRKIKDDTKEFSIANSTKVIEPAFLEIDLTDKDKYGNYLVKTFKGDHLDAFERKLNEMPLKNLQNPAQKAALMKSLRRGDPKIPVTFVADGKEYKRYIEFNARYKNFKVSDSYLSVKEKKEQEKELQQSVPEVKQDNAKEKQKGSKQTKPSSSAKVTGKPAAAKKQNIKTGKAASTASVPKKPAIKNGKPASKKRRGSKVGG
ncbi:hypothetical protein [Chitinophaga niabensis]|uniref:Uncharacterized protein n=1 Tax=Chitinophaga niabensis TaxID=536979 RepID=A0A1N6E5B5_9BACT|nr:hypothetical protein [Chitinophaga niabensis]SIN78204.1 hypothetical protein SAMN04488055_1314 [Chitinophaga niabensis]